VVQQLQGTGYQHTSLCIVLHAHTVTKVKRLDLFHTGLLSTATGHSRQVAGPRDTDDYEKSDVVTSDMLSLSSGTGKAHLKTRDRFAEYSSGRADVLWQYDGI
jgi:hypothetical protein